jgi:hypothetical protein
MSQDATSLGAPFGDWYSAADEPEEVTFGPVRGLSVSGQGEPGGSAHTEALNLLLAVAKQMLALAAAANTPFSMPVLEGRWWVEDERHWSAVPREQWRWHLFLRITESVPVRLADEAREAARAALGTPAVARVQLATFTEGLSVQAMHRGHYADEPKTLARMDELMERRGLIPNGLHHEIYLSDVRETDPGRMRTILRQPVRRRDE